MDKYNKLPVIDMQEFYSDMSQANIIKLAHKIKEIYQTVRFAYIINHNTHIV